MLRPFKWGPSFLELNLRRLEEYAGAADSGEVLRIQRKFLPGEATSTSSGGT